MRAREHLQGWSSPHIQVGARGMSIQPCSAAHACLCPRSQLALVRAAVSALPPPTQSRRTRRHPTLPLPRAARASLSGGYEDSTARPCAEAASAAASQPSRAASQPSAKRECASICRGAASGAAPGAAAPPAAGRRERMETCTGAWQPPASRPLAPERGARERHSVSAHQLAAHTRGSACAAARGAGQAGAQGQALSAIEHGGAGRRAPRGARLQVETLAGPQGLRERARQARARRLPPVHAQLAHLARRARRAPVSPGHWFRVGLGSGQTLGHLAAGGGATTPKAAL